LEQVLRQAIGDHEKALSGRDLTEAFVELEGRDKLVKLLAQHRPDRPGRLLELLIALRPPYLFTTETSGLILKAAQAVGLEVSVCFPDLEPIKQAAPNRLVVIPLAGLVDRPDTLILSDADLAAMRTREPRTYRFLKESAASHDLLTVGFSARDPWLKRLLQELGSEMKPYDRQALLLLSGVTAPERKLLELRGGQVIAQGGEQALSLLETLPEHIAQSLSAGPAETNFVVDELVKKLRRRIHDDTRFLRTAGLSQPEHMEIGELPTLDEIYVEPSLSPWKSEAESIDFSQSRQLSGLPDDMARLEHLEPLELLRRFHRLVIIGEPASGKTQLLDYLAYKITDDTGGNKLGVEGLVPLVVPIREYYTQHREGQSLAAFLRVRLAKLIGEEPAAMDLLFALGRVMFFLDGLDEVPRDEDRRRVADEIGDLLISHEVFTLEQDLSDEIPPPQWELKRDWESVESPQIPRCIITSRPAGYRAAQLTAELPHVELDLLDDDRIKALLGRWYKRVLRVQHQDWSDNQVQEQAEQRRNELFDGLGTFEGLREVVRNPLMLTMAVFIHHMGQELPERRADFYQRAAQLLTQAWIKEKFQKHLELPREETLMSALERMGFELQRGSGENVISGECLEEILTKVFREKEGYGEERARREAANLRDLMRSLIGVVMERGTNAFGFTHLSFQEYYAARHLAQGDGRHLALEVLPSNLYQPRWDQVIRMVLQLAPPDDAEKIFDVLSKVRHPFDDLFHPNPRRLAELLSEQNRVKPEQRRKVAERLLAFGDDRSSYVPYIDISWRLALIKHLDPAFERRLGKILLKWNSYYSGSISPNLDELADPRDSEEQVFYALSNRMQNDTDATHRWLDKFFRLSSPSEQIDEALDRIRNEENEMVRYAAAENLASLLNVSNWEAIATDLRSLNKNRMNTVWEKFDPLRRVWDYQAEGLVFDVGQQCWVLKQSTETLPDSAQDEADTLPEIHRIREITMLERPLAGIEGLKPALDLMLDQYPKLPTDEKTQVRKTAGRWFRVGVEDLVEAGPERREAVIADLEMQTSFLRRLTLVIRDEDHKHKAQLFDAIWPAVENLHQAGALEHSGLARYLFEVLYALYLYLPDEKGKSVEQALARWRSEPGLAPDHPLRTHSYIEKILHLAERRKQSWR
jgi:hypothetical protein